MGKEVKGEKRRGMKEGKQNQSLGFKCNENKFKEKKAKRSRGNGKAKRYQNCFQKRKKSK